MTQKDAVYSAIVSVLSSLNISFQDGVTDTATVLSKDMRAKVIAVLVRQFLDGKIALSDESKSKLENVDKLKDYINNLISNWLRRDTRLNGGKTVVTATAPKARTISGDPQLKALKQLYSAQTDQIKRQEIQEFIDRRIAELT